MNNRVKTITADKLRMYDQIEEPHGTFCVLSVRKSWEVIAWGDLCNRGEAPQRMKRIFSPTDTVAVFR